MGKPTKNLSLMRRRNNRESTKPRSYDADSGESSQIRRERLMEEDRVKDAGACFWSNLRGKLFIPRMFEDDGHQMNSTTIAKVIFI
jgi:hypothetical protein